MNDVITLNFTPWQLFAAIGGICLIIITIYVVSVLKETKKTLRQINEAVYNVNEIIEDIQTTKMVITSKIAEIKKASDIVKKFKEIKDKKNRKGSKKTKGDK